jgi:hypothetical protein
MNIEVRNGNQLANSYSHKRWGAKLKGLSHEKERVNSAENLSASPFKRDLLTDITSSHTYLAGQSLSTTFFKTKKPHAQKKIWHSVTLASFLSLF